MITASYLTLAGAPHNDPPRYPMRERAMAAHAVGIPAIGIRLSEPLDPATLKYAQVPEAEWAELSRPANAGTAQLLAAAAGDLGITRVNAGVTHPSTIGDAARHLRQLLDITVPLGITVAVEPIAFGPYRKLDDIMDILAQAGVSASDSCGTLFDMWQITASTAKTEPITGNRPWYRMVAEIQVCGVRMNDPRDPFTASQDRPLIADSELSIRTWLRLLQDTGITAPVSYEQPHAAWRELSLLQTAEAAAADMALLS